MKFKIAILQKRAKLGLVKKNISDVIQNMEESSKNSADILLLPECFITGYDLPMTYEKSIDDNNKEIERICGAAKSVV